MLKAEMEGDMISGILGNLKASLDLAGHVSTDQWAFGKLIHSLLSSALVNIDDMR
jgi:hypothetical protein